jgi:PAS domain S-box-containing protein
MSPSALGSTNNPLSSTIAILIVDDLESDRDSYKRYLQSDRDSTYKVLEAETLEEGLELWRSQKPNIALIDLNLPDGDGLEFLAAINEVSRGERTPVIMLTGQGDEKKAVKSIKSGASDYLVKGDISAKLLSNTIKQVLRETTLNRQLWRSQQQQTVIAEIALRIRESLDLAEISNAIVREVRQFIKADRAVVYQFNPDMSGTIVAEDIIAPWQPCLNIQVADTCFRDNLGGTYRDGKFFVANDIYQANLTDCHLQLLERFQVRANLVVPILLPNADQRILWGLLIVHQCSTARIWQDSDILLLQQLSVQLAIGIQQALTYQQVQTELAERKRAEALLLTKQAEIEERNALLEKTSADLECTIEELRVSAEDLIYQQRQLEYEQIRYQNLFNFAPDGYLVTDPVGRILEANQVILDLLEVDRDYIVERFLAIFVAAHDQEIFFNRLGYILSHDNSAVTWEITLNPYQSEAFPAEIILTKNINPANQNIQLLWIIRNISDRKRAEQELLQLNQSLEAKVIERTQELWKLNKLQRAILDGTDYAIISNNLNGIIQTFNAGAEKMLGYSMEEVIGKFTPEIFHDPQEIIDKIAKASKILGKDIGEGFEALIYMASQGLIDEEWINIRKDGSRFPISISVTVLKDNNDQPIGTLSVRKDISDRKLAEESLRESEKRFASLASAAPVAIFQINQHNECTYVNDFWSQITGQETSMALGYGWLQTIHPDDREQIYRQWTQAIGQQTYYQGEGRCIKSDGTICFFYCQAIPEVDQDGVFTGYIGTLTDISDRKQTEIQLQAINEELLRATKLKDEFLANMSHELRTPLNSILGMSESLKDEILGSMNEKQLKAITTIESSGEHLLSLINDILDLSKISSGMMALDIASVSVRDLCNTSLSFVKQQAFQKSIQIHSYIPPYINNINIDERRIKQVLINLLTNAVKFTPRQGQVSLLVSVGSGDTWQGGASIPQQLKFQNEPTIVFQVVDTGIGIATKNLSQLFQPFVQIDSSLNRQYEGTGLGLALVKQIVELHGGQVMVESEIGKGSRFTVALPYTMSQSCTSESAPIATTLQSQDVNPENEPESAIAPLILLAEDNEANIQTFSAYLIAINYRVIIARNGEEAVAIAKANSPDIILMDIQMPIMDGLEATKQIRLDPNLINIPIIALTALAMEGDREMCLASGANAYLSKPIKLKALADSIRSILGNRK